MNADNKTIEVTICLGSSCFARGNSENLAILKSFESAHQGKIRLQLTGSLCQDRCKLGPNLTVDGQSYSGLGADQLRELLQKLLRESRPHGTA